MAEVESSTSRGEHPVELVGEASCSGADESTSPELVPPSIAAESPSFLTWMWIHILTACSGVWGPRGRGLSFARVLGLASRVQPSLEVSNRIEASKPTWTEVPSRDIRHSVSVPRSSQLSVWEELKESAPRFFHDYRLKIGPLIAEGGQAQIFEAKFKGFSHAVVLKVFKLDAGFSLADLKQLWPRSMRRGGEDGSEFALGQERSSRFVFEDAYSNYFGARCFILFATLLKDGRFAFMMLRYWGDLRTLIDLKVEYNNHPWEFDLLFGNGRQQPPFSLDESLWIMKRIARGMQELHGEGVLHRDLKAANVLLKSYEDFKIPILGECMCVIADYECAMFVEGTGFWRAPEVLKELPKNEEDRNKDIWTEKVDVYSFGMTCYEILTGQIPFDGYTKSKWDDVIRGERPFLPPYVFPKLRELVEACWHDKQSQRPSFELICEELASIRENHASWN